MHNAQCTLHISKIPARQNVKVNIIQEFVHRYSISDAKFKIEFRFGWGTATKCYYHLISSTNTIQKKWSMQLGEINANYFQERNEKKVACTWWMKKLNAECVYKWKKRSQFIWFVSILWIPFLIRSFHFPINFQYLIYYSYFSFFCSLSVASFIFLFSAFQQLQDKMKKKKRAINENMIRELKF